MKNLLESLKKAGQKVLSHQTADGSRILILPHGGRVLGLFSARDEENFYWTNEALASAGTARDFFAGDQWHNSGGDRTWLAPEIDIFFPNFPKLDKYFQQRSLDPGSYRVSSASGVPVLTNDLDLHLSRAGKKVALRISKTFGPAANPLRHEDRALMKGVKFAGYTQFTSLEFRKPADANIAAVGLWNLVQMPHGGSMVFPTFSKSQPFLVMGKIPRGDLRVSEREVIYRMRQKGEHKISLRAATVAGRVGYLHGSKGRSSLIVRNFVINPSGEYVDAPWSDPKRLGFSTQACNVHSGLGRFSELEYHIPAIGKGTGASSCSDAAQVWAFRGNPDAIARISRLLLGSAPAVG
jgi:hypothetical protein